MSSVSFTVPGVPHGKGRPRFGRTKGGGVRTYNDEKTTSYESLVAFIASQACKGVALFSGPLWMNIVVRLVPAASASKRNTAAMLAGDMSPIKRPDLDNIVKAILDGCNNVAFSDDAQVCRITASKVYSDKAGVDVQITPMTGSKLTVSA